MLEDFIHHIYDIFYIVQYFFDNIKEIFSILFTPLVWIFDFFKGFFVSAFGTPPAPVSDWAFSNDIMTIFSSIPYFSAFMVCLGIGITILFLVFVLKRLSLF